MELDIDGSDDGGCARSEKGEPTDHDTSSCLGSAMDIEDDLDVADMSIDENHISKMVFFATKVCKLCQHGPPHLPWVCLAIWCGIRTCVWQGSSDVFPGCAQS